MSKPSVFVTRIIPEAAARRLAEAAQVETWQEESAPPYEVIREKSQNADALFTLLTDRIDAALIAGLPGRFKVISQMAVGFDNIDAGAATQKGIPVGHTPGVLTETTADFAWALLMAAARRVVEGADEVHEGTWRAWGPDVLTGYDVSGATLGIIGFGRIGQAVARRAGGFGMRVLYYDPKRQSPEEESLGAVYADPDTLLRESDFISLHPYLSKETYHMIGAEQLEKMKPTAVLINTSRGPVVDNEALAQALEGGQIAAAALDVTEPEPIPQDSALLKLKNAIITPHIASASKATRLKMAQIAVDNLLAGLRGEKLPFCANPEVYEKHKGTG